MRFGSPTAEHNSPGRRASDLRALRCVLLALPLSAWIDDLTEDSVEGSSRLPACVMFNRH